jgi:tRNA-specific 2-thiouridylase
MKKGKAVGLLSGGLDSILAVRMMMDQGLEIIAVNMKTPFYSCESKGKCYSALTAERFKIHLREIYGDEDFLEMVKKPRYGYGKNMNPCIDCRIYLFGKAKEIMEEEKADFVFTGEVLGERPMSQRRGAMSLIERESGLKGRILRPLSARLLEPTIAEEQGLVDRTKLLDIQGRSRKPQLALAKEFGIDEFPTPAGGCLLTDQTFSVKLKESFEHGEDSLRYVTFLKIGRHFRLPSGVKVITGRDRSENETLMSLSHPEELKLTAHEHKSTFALLLGSPNEENLKLAAEICARYSDGKDCLILPVRVWRVSESQYQIIQANPMEPSLLESIRIGT